MKKFPYPLLSGDELRCAMNSFSEQAKAFYVVISYDSTSGYFIPSSELDSEWIRFAFNPLAGSIHPTKPLAEIDWNIEPVLPEDYNSRFELVKQHLQLGNTFLVNLTQPTRVHTNSTLLQLYEQARAPYKIWLRDKFVCFSPECFVRITDGEISTFPMKGTLDATLPNAMNQLLENEKEKAEHATIVDLLRNDLSMVASGVEVVRYRYVDRIKTHRGELLQVSSEIRGRLAPDYKSKLGDIVFAMLPAGSICGAPKARTLEIIQEAEGYERGFYTGICGCFDGTNFDSAVMIRFLEQTEDGFVFKSGGGITYMSDRDEEYRELIQKVYVPVH